ncbi:hypothetical protein AJ80_01665 [Polytolypa hystricis UAMH7299]|uniref:Zn(2)-C6 fungal-type domain-containing protein n=1 Tax=Polytolypa hystricis (strain UAMH7299) TaxID=1447883 RepID=A0A2B7Z0F3_POLH7|nr:hypothetical protein AJ80_01665 [Polytolypa hystricis UAMH7299]
MDQDVQFMCPRPRNPRACDDCKRSKTRCLPSETTAGVCQRCARYGSRCSFNNTHSKNQSGAVSTAKGNSKAPRKKLEDENLLPKILPSELVLNHSDDSGELMQHHQHVFQGKRSRYGLSALLPNGQQQSRKQGVSVTEKELKITAQRANNILAVFKKMNHHFPFVTIPKDATAEAMSKEQSFLFLAILTVTSMDDIRLQRLLNARFRTLLSTKVVMQGEKSLDYLQGLLVYLAWYPSHLRPMSIQLYQYIQIAISLISDMGLEDLNITTEPLDPAVKDAAKRACLGCYYLSTMTSMAFKKKPNNFRLTEPTRAFMSDLTNQPTGSVNAACAASARFMDLIERVTDPHYNILLELSLEGTEGCPLQRLVQTFQLQLAECDRHASNNFDGNFLHHLYTMLKIYSIPLSHYTHSNNPPIPNGSITNTFNPHSAFPILRTCFSHIRFVLEHFINLNLEEYARLVFVEWSMLVQTINTFSRLCCYLIPEIPDWANVVIPEERTRFLVDLECLGERLEMACNNNKKLARKAAASEEDGEEEDSPPDLLYMFRCVLQLVHESHSKASDTAPNYDTQGRRGKRRPEEEGDDDGDDTDEGREKRRKVMSRCPVMSGSIVGTEYWNALEKVNQLQQLTSTNGNVVVSQPQQQPQQQQQLPPPYTSADTTTMPGSFPSTTTTSTTHHIDISESWQQPPLYTSFENMTYSAAPDFNDWITLSDELWYPSAAVLS